MTSVLVVDDHPLFRTALVTAVRRLAYSATVIEAQTLADALRQLHARAFDLVLLDLRMPDSEGFLGLLSLKAARSETPIAVVSGSEDLDIIRRALAFGAKGFIPKSAGLDVMTLALRSILSGVVWAPAAALVEEPQVSVELPSLTPTQLRILVGLRKGQLNKQIAFEMGVQEGTVKAHMTAIFRKLGVINRTQAVIAAQSIALDIDAA